MGLVYSAEDVITGRLPRPDAHYDAGRFILSRLAGQPGETGASKMFGGVGGVMIYGSTALGTPNIRSDVDVFFTYDPGNPRVLTDVGWTLAAAEARFLVSVEPNVHALDALADPLQHSLDAPFASHLQYVQDNMPEWCRNRPADTLQCDGDGMGLERLRWNAERYAAQKRRQFARAQLHYRQNRQQVDPKAMQRALELPNAIGRKILSYVTANDAKAGAKISSDRAATVARTGQIMERLHEFLPPGSLRQTPDAFHQLVKCDKDYTEALLAARGSIANVYGYRDWLQANYLKPLELAHAVSDFWTQVLAGEADVRAVGAAGWEP